MLPAIIQPGIPEKGGAIVFDSEKIKAGIYPKLQDYLTWFPQGTADDFDAIDSAYDGILKILSECNHSAKHGALTNLSEKVCAEQKDKKQASQSIVADFMHFIQDYLNTLPESGRQLFYALASSLVWIEKVDLTSNFNKAKQAVVQAASTMDTIEAELANQICNIPMANEDERNQVVQALRSIRDPSISVTALGKERIAALLDYLNIDDGNDSDDSEYPYDPEMTLIQESQMPAVYAIIEQYAENMKKMTCEDIARDGSLLAHDQEIIASGLDLLACHQEYSWISGNAKNAFNNFLVRYRDVEEKLRDMLSSVKNTLENLMNHPLYKRYDMCDEDEDEVIVDLGETLDTDEASYDGSAPSPEYDAVLVYIKAHFSCERAKNLYKRRDDRLATASEGCDEALDNYNNALANKILCLEPDRKRNGL